MTPRLASMLIAAPFGGLAIFLLWAWVQGAPFFGPAVLLLLVATVIELMAD